MTGNSTGCPSRERLAGSSDRVPGQGVGRIEFAVGALMWRGSKVVLSDYQTTVFGLSELTEVV